MRVTKEARMLRMFYLLILLFGVVMVLLMHTIDRPTLDIFRVPTFIGEVSVYNGLPYLPVLRIYQLTMYTSLVALSIDVICLTKLRSKRMLQLSEISTIVGVSLLFLSVLFFSYNFLFFDQTFRSTTLIYIAVPALVMMVDLMNLRFDERLLKEDK